MKWYYLLYSYEYFEMSWWLVHRYYTVIFGPMALIFHVMMPENMFVNKQIVTVQWIGYFSDAGKACILFTP